MKIIDEFVFKIQKKWKQLDIVGRIRNFYKKDDLDSFNKIFARHWTDIFDTRFLYIFLAVGSFILLNILYLANLDYESLQDHFARRLREQYVISLSTLYEQKPPASIITSARTKVSSSVIVDIETRKSMNARVDIGRIEREIQKTGILKVLSSKYDRYAALPDLLLIDEDMVIAEVSPPTRSIDELKARNIKQENYDFTFSDFFVDGAFDPFSIPLERKGSAYFVPTEEMIQEPEKKYGWRDSKEITMVMKKRERIIEYCFKRVAREYSNLSGSVVVRFEILHTGKIDPGSVRIVNSTLYNKKIEQCIKNALIRCRDFKKLDESMGIVSVKQKFIFN